MGMDIRTPIGGLFTILGLMLIVFGVMTNGSEMYQKSYNINVNIWWGLVMLVFGVCMLYFGARGSRRKKVASAAAAGTQPSQRIGPNH